MKLNLHPKEFLAIYSLLEQQTHEEFNGSVDASLKEVYNRMRSYLVSALGRRDDNLVEDSFDAWERGQKKKIADLEAQNESLKSLINSKEFPFCEEEAQPAPPVKPKSAKNVRFRK